MFNRRVFVMKVWLGSVAVVADQALASEAMVEESDPQALALGYHADGRKTDKVKFPNYSDSDACVSCVHYQARVGATVGTCKVFPDRLVAATGWCSAFEVSI